MTHLPTEIVEKGNSMHPLHSHLSEELARARQADIRAARLATCRPGPRPEKPRAVRVRVGWLLVGVGLRVAMARRQTEPAH